MEAHPQDAPGSSSAGDLLWQALALTRGLWDDIYGLDFDLPEGTHHPMIEPLNRLDERIFFALRSADVA